MLEGLEYEYGVTCAELAGLHLTTNTNRLMQRIDQLILSERIDCLT
jgi:hypothetical protein